MRSPRKLVNYRVRGKDPSALATEKDAAVRPGEGMKRSEGASTLAFRPGPRAPAGIKDRSGGEGSHFSAGVRVISAEGAVTALIQRCLALRVGG